ncbi:baculoviral IAP repeat-containing protein 7-like [Haliotis rufescens]|uniref:baculoviral IAP repeat-containing protein 7-like n=1 Tax=Haliotis rufescens TaxID=6454 RepID=UPI00201F2A95|nr:baculoviral IAP repeat-containing protein 7-like [Haliotis rufescens]
MRPNFRGKYPYLLDSDLRSIPRAFTRDWREIISQVLAGMRPSHQMNLQEMVALISQRPSRYPRVWMTLRERIETLLEAGEEISDMTSSRLETIAAAGFYHTGKGTGLTCYHCGCQALDWDSTDDPYLRHEELQPKCPIIKRGVDLWRGPLGNVNKSARRRGVSESS